MIVSHFVPDALIADRSAANDGLPQDGVLYVISNERVRDLELPGLIVSPRKGPGPLDDDPSWAAGLHVTSDARTLVDNLALSRGRGGRLARTLSRAELEDWVVRKAQLRPDGWLQQLRGRAIEIAEELGVPDRQGQVEELVGAVAGTRPVRSGAGRLLAARAAGGEWDPARVERFDELASYLAAIPEKVEVPALLEAPPGDLDGTLPFFEAYFSNFIEGTKFDVKEAVRIAIDGEVSPARPADAHDVQATYRIAVDPMMRAHASRSGEEFLEQLRDVHRVLMAARPDMRPGLFKDVDNYFGAYKFVEADLLEGTLLRGFDTFAPVTDAFQRAAALMLVITECHPFYDGNGRTARLISNAALSAAGQVRIVIPSIYRNDYLRGLRGVSNANGQALLAVLGFAQRWTTVIDWRTFDGADAMLRRTHAYDDPAVVGEDVKLRMP